MIANSPETEIEIRGESILNAVLGSPELMPELRFLPAAAMPDELSRAAWAAALRIDAEGRDVDLVSIAEIVKPAADVGAAPRGIVERLLAICDGSRWVGNVVGIAQQLLEEHTARQLRLRVQSVLADRTLRSSDLRDRLGGVMEDHSFDVADSLLTARQLIEHHAALKPPLVDGLLRRGEVMNLISAPKIGKSWTTYGLALSVITGRTWLGAFPCTPGRVLIIDNELHPATLAFRLKTVADAMGLATEDYGDRLSVVTLRGHLASIRDRSRLFRGVRPGSFDVVVMDALYRLVPDDADENSNSAMKGVYNTIDRYAADLDAAMVLVHHASKGNQSDKSTTDVGAGAGSQARAADSHLILRPHAQDGAFVLDAAVRSFPPVEPVVLRWTFPVWERADDLNPADLKRFPTKSEQQQRDRDREGFDAIVTALRSAGPQTARQLRTSARLSRERLDRLVATMEADQRLAISTTTIKGNPSKIYHLAPHLRDSDGDVGDGTAHISPTWGGTWAGGPLKGDRPPPHVPYGPNA